MCVRLCQLDFFNYKGQKSNSKCPLIKGNLLPHIYGCGWLIATTLSFHLVRGAGRSLPSILPAISPGILTGNPELEPWPGLGYMVQRWQFGERQFPKGKLACCLL